MPRKIFIFMILFVFVWIRIILRWYNVYRFLSLSLVKKEMHEGQQDGSVSIQPRLTTRSLYTTRFTLSTSCVYVGLLYTTPATRWRNAIGLRGWTHSEPPPPRYDRVYSFNIYIYTRRFASNFHIFFVFFYLIFFFQIEQLLLTVGIRWHLESERLWDPLVAS